MANDAVLLNSDDAQAHGFIPDEGPTGTATVYPGTLLERNSSGEWIPHDSEPAVGTEAVGWGVVAGLGFDPDIEKGSTYASGETIRAYHIPIGGKADVRLAAGGDLATSAEANISKYDKLVEADVGALKKYVGAGVDPTATTTETVYVPGAVYVALEAVDNSGASAGHANQVYIEVVRIA